MRYGSLFSGVGCFDLGLERAGMSCAWQVERDAACRGVLACHWPDVKRYEDVCNVGSANLEPVDAVVGGFPCQDLSVAGRRAGLAGERSGLWWEFHRILSELNPRWAIIENVPGLLSSNGGRDFAAIVHGLAKLGYGVSWRILDAQYFGVPQRRRRVFIVGSLGSGRSAEVLFERDGGAWDSTPRREAGARVAGTLAAGAHPSGFNGQDAERGCLVANGLTHHHERNEPTEETFVVGALCGASRDAGWRFGADEAAAGQPVVYQCHGSNVGESGTLRAGNGGLTGGVPFVAHALSAEGADASEDGTGRGTPLVALSVSLRGREGGATAELSGDVATAIRSSQGGGDKPHALVTAGVRRLTPLECERLQGLPDDHTRWGVIDGAIVEQSDSARYRQCGNGGAVPVMEWIGRRITKLEATS